MICILAWYCPSTLGFAADQRFAIGFPIEIVRSKVSIYLSLDSLHGSFHRIDRYAREGKFKVENPDTILRSRAAP